MRLSLVIKPETKLVLPLNYEQVLQGFLYRIIEDENFSSFLHEKGYITNKRRFKLFTFSRLNGNYTIDRRTKTIRFEQEVYWKISSIIPQFIQELGNSLLTKSKLEWNGQAIRVERLEYQHSDFQESLCRIRMISPITVYSTYQTSEKKITQYFGPNDAVFPHLIHENLKKKYYAYYQKELGPGFEIFPIRVSEKNKVVTRFKGFYITGWNGIYELRGTPDALRFAYAVGIGGRNSQGFGMFEILN